MKSKIELLLIAQVAIGSFLYAQNKVNTFIKGDIVPAHIVIGKMVNYKMNKTKFSDFKGKLVILDFWSTHCSPCVAGLPRMDSLQRKYGNKIAIIPITSEDSRTIQNYFIKRGFKLPSVVEDRILSKTFPQTALDLHVWIDQKGKIIATTSGEDVNFKTVDEFFKTGKVNAKERIDIVGGFDRSKPLFINGNGGSGDNFLGRSIMTAGSIVGVQTGGMAFQYYPEKNGEIMLKSIMQWNGSPIDLYEPIINGLGRIDLTLFFKETENGQIVPISKAQDLGSVLKDLQEYTNKTNGIVNYELTIPAPGVKEHVFLREYLLNDLNRYFDYTARITKVKLPSWVVVRLKDHNILSKEEEKNIGMIFNDKIDLAYFEGVKSMPMDDFIRFTKANYYLSPPIFNETGLSKEKITLNNLHLKFEQDKANRKTLNLEEWRAAFQRNGLDIKVEDREVEVMVFKKKDTPSK